MVGGSSLSFDCKERLGKSAAHVLGLLANEGLDSKARLAVIDRGNLKSVIATDGAQLMGDCPSVTVESVPAFVTKFIREKEAEVAQMMYIQNQLLNKIAILDGKGVVRNQIDDLYR